MIANRMKTIPLAAVTITVMILAGSPSAQAKPVKLVPAGHITNGIDNPESVAVAPDGNIYVTDPGNNRVQELNSSGEFVLMFGKEVNETKDKAPGVTETEKNICTEEEIKLAGVKCRAGVEGTDAGAFRGAQSVTVSPSTEDVYVEDESSNRIDEYTANGQFALMFGKEVNETTKGNICTAISGNVCKAGLRVLESSEHGAFNLGQFAGSFLAVGPGPDHLLYVADEHRVQEFDAQGEWKGEIPLTSISSAPGWRVGALAVDAIGDVYLTYGLEGRTDMMRELNPSGAEVNELTVSPRNPGGEVATIEGIALDSEGHLAVSALEFPPEEGVAEPFGSLLEAGTGGLITRFSIPRGGSADIAFNGNDELYVAASEVLVYKPLPVAELKPSPVSCVPGVEVESSVTLDCALNGEVNPFGVAGTEVWFQSGRTPSLGSETPKQSGFTGNGLEPVSSVPIKEEGREGVRPNETFYVRLAGFDENVQPPEEPLLSKTVSFLTSFVAPKIVGAPSVQFVRSSAAVMFAELNPENASTSYEFQYGSCEENNPGKCSGSPYSAEATALESGVYGKIGTTQEVTGLQPATVYHYRLVAESENTQKTERDKATGPEGSFTTRPAPVPQAVSGAPSAVGATSATVSGTVNPDGQPATYAFELGVYAGGATQYGVVFSGPAGTGTLAVTETLGLTGLQPGTTYAYRIEVASGYGAATGEAVLFTTAGLSAVLAIPTPLAQLPIPAIAFPTAVTPPKPKTAPRKAKQKAKQRTKKGKKGKSKQAKKARNSGSVPGATTRKGEREQQ